MKMGWPWKKQEEPSEIPSVAKISFLLYENGVFAAEIERGCPDSKAQTSYFAAYTATFLRQLTTGELNEFIKQNVALASSNDGLNDLSALTIRAFESFEDEDFVIPVEDVLGDFNDDE